MLHSAASCRWWEPLVRRYRPWMHQCRWGLCDVCFSTHSFCSLLAGLQQKKKKKKKKKKRICFSRCSQATKTCTPSIWPDPSRPDLWCITPTHPQIIFSSLAKWAAVPGDWEPMMHPFWPPLVPCDPSVKVQPPPHPREQWPTVANCSSLQCVPCSAGLLCALLAWIWIATLLNANMCSPFWEAVCMCNCAGTGNAASCWKHHVAVQCVYLRRRLRTLSGT